MSDIMLPKFPKDFKYRNLAEATEVTETAEKGVYTGSLHADWCIGVVPHGGYLTSVLLNASATYFNKYHADQPDAIHISQTFSTRCSIGPFRLTVVPIKIGRQYSFVRVELFQGKHLCLTAVVTHASFAQEAASKGLNGPEMVPKPRYITPFEECEGQEPKGRGADFRVAEKKLNYRFPKGTVYGSRGNELRREQWVSFADGKDIMPTDLGMISDMFIPLPINLAPLSPNGERMVTSWYPTLWLSLEVKKPGPWRWVGVFVEIKKLENGRSDIEVIITDEKGELIGLSRHLAIVVSIARNNAKL
ncbi:hypothetical protein EX30DRAFT_339201 [Ascodesmis nigricans]|uniref:Thioesterase family protein n=1 Tax=Ascodesmis nigricans TaxID=341454 RepID=A0A4S2N1E3_9PEZI|nr:hypothetical protein EX30DRAFT_339201 [Ascodesmis nigricans]